MLFVNTYLRGQNNLADALFAFATQNEREFDLARIAASHGAIDVGTRNSRVLRRWAETSQAEEFGHLVLETAQEVISSMGLVNSTVSDVELEMAQHGDGGFYRRHIDTLTGTHRDSAARVLSCVYYFHAPQKRFTGGNLRLFPLPLSRGSQEPFEIEPVHNRLVVFPSWMPHEVMPTRVPSQRFEHSRFSINCWLYGHR